MRGPATPQRGCAAMKSRSAATAPGSGTASGFAESTSSAARPRDALVDVRAEAERRLVVDRLDARRHGAGDVRDHDQLVDLRRGSPAATPRARADARARRRRRRPSRRAPCDRRRPSARAVSSHEKRVARSSPARDVRARGRRARARPRRRGRRPRRRRRVAGDLAQRRLVRAATTGVPLAIASSTGIPKPSKRDGSTSAAAPR